MSPRFIYIVINDRIHLLGLDDSLPPKIPLSLPSHHLLMETLAGRKSVVLNLEVLISMSHLIFLVNFPSSVIAESFLRNPRLVSLTTVLIYNILMM